MDGHIQRIVDVLRRRNGKRVMEVVETICAALWPIDDPRVQAICTAIDVVTTVKRKPVRTRR